MRIVNTPVLDADSATFVWKGRRAPDLIGDMNDWDARRPLKLAKTGPSRWELRLPLPPDAYIEYVYLLDGQRVDDPANPRRVFNSFDADNHYFYMPGGGATPLAERRPGAPAGRLTAHVLPASFPLGEGGQIDLYERTVYLYQPAAQGPCPLLVVLDGAEFIRLAHLPLLVDNLLAQGRIRPLAMAFVCNGGPHRMSEYACSDTTLAFLLHNVLPFAHSRLNLLDWTAQPGAHGILGASMGGLMAAYAGLRFPQVFGKVLSQSGAFLDSFNLGRLFAREVDRVPNLWMDVGRFESLLEPNRAMYDVFARAGLNPIYREYNAGHNYTAWRDDVWRGLEALFPA